MLYVDSCSRNLYVSFKMCSKYDILIAATVLYANYIVGKIWSTFIVLLTSLVQDKSQL